MDINDTFPTLTVADPYETVREKNLRLSDRHNYEVPVEGSSFKHYSITICVWIAVALLNI